MTPQASSRTLAVVTGAASGIGQALARLCAEAGHDLVLVADRGPLDEVAFELRQGGATVDALHADLGTTEGLDKLLDAVAGRPVDALLIDASHGPGRGFLTQDFAAARQALGGHVTATLACLHGVGRTMRERGQGRILITGTAGGGTAACPVGQAGKAFIEAFTQSLRDELKADGVSVTLLMPGLADAPLLDRGQLLEPSGTQAAQADPAELARIGYKAMCQGEADVVAGWKGRLRAMLGPGVDGLPAQRQHALAEPGSAAR